MLGRKIIFNLFINLFIKLYTYLIIVFIATKISKHYVMHSMIMLLPARCRYVYSKCVCFQIHGLLPASKKETTSSFNGVPNNYWDPVDFVLGQLFLSNKL